MLVFGATVPGLHGVGSAAPVPQKCPRSHRMQSSALVIGIFSNSIEAFWKVPWRHGSAAAAPSAQYDPGVHGSHTKCFSFSWNLPASHLLRVPMLVLGATVPGLHGVCLMLPVDAK